ncbi:hypothetical protein AVEN_4125-1, partial [Araneus ventricosus]
RWFERRLPLSWAFTRRLGYAICPKAGFFSPIQVERLGTSFTEAPKCASLALRFPYSSSPTWRISDFLASSRGPNLGRIFVLPLNSQRGPQKAIRPFQFDFKLFGIPTLPIHYANFHGFLTLTNSFSFPCSKNRRMPRFMIYDCVHRLVKNATVPGPSPSNCFEILFLYFNHFFTSATDAVPVVLFFSRCKREGTDVVPSNCQVLEPYDLSSNPSVYIFTSVSYCMHSG